MRAKPQENLQHLHSKLVPCDRVSNTFLSFVLHQNLILHTSMRAAAAQASCLCLTYPSNRHARQCKLHPPTHPSTLPPPHTPAYWPGLCLGARPCSCSCWLCTASRSRGMPPPPTCALRSRCSIAAQTPKTCVRA